MQDKDFDRFIREALNNQQEPAYNPADWDMLEDRLANFHTPQGQAATGSAGTIGGSMAKLGFVASAVLLTVLNTVAVLKPGIFETNKEVLGRERYQAVAPLNPENGQSTFAAETGQAKAAATIKEAEGQVNYPAAAGIAGQQEVPAISAPITNTIVSEQPRLNHKITAKATQKPYTRKNNAQNRNVAFANPGSFTNTPQPVGSGQLLAAGKPGVSAAADCKGNLKPELAYLVNGADTLRAKRLSLNTCQEINLRLTASDKDGDNVTITSNIAEVLPEAKLTIQENNTALAEWKATPGMARQQPYIITFWLDDKRCAGAQLQSYQVAISVTPAFVVSLNSTASIEKGQPTMLEVIGAPRGSAFRWFNQNGMLGNIKSNRLEVSPAQTTTYKVQVISPAGCVATDSARVEVKEAELFASLSQTRFIPNIITPNSDGINDYFETKLPENGPLKLVIFDRWGKQVYYQENYKNNWNASDLPAGIYYYTLSAGQNPKPYKGWVEVVR